MSKNGMGASGVVKWEDPPESNRGRGVTHWNDVAVALRARPMVWACVRVVPKSGGASVLASYIRNGRYAAFRDHGNWEAISRRVGGKYRVYARYVGPASISVVR